MRTNKSVTTLFPAPSYKRVNAMRLYEDVVWQMVHQIMGGTFQPGVLLPTEPELAQSFGVSRTVVREAMRVLSSKGLIVVKHGSGMRVQQPDMWNYLDPLVLLGLIHSGRSDGLIDELLELRRIFEIEAATLATERCTADDLASLSSILEEMRKVVSDPESYTLLDSELHDRILTMARNRLLREALRPVAEVLDAVRLITIRQPDAIEGSMRGHEEIYCCIEGGEAASAGDAMRRHILQFEVDIRAALKDSGNEPFQQPISTEKQAGKYKNDG